MHATVTKITTDHGITDVEEQPSSSSAIVDTLQANAIATAAEEAGQFSQGAIAVVELWVFCPQKNRLVLERGGCWTCPSLGSVTDVNNDVSVSVPPGVDLVGNLWSTSKNPNSTSTTTKRRGSQTNKLQWTSLEGLMQDPDTAKGDRMAQLRELGMDRAAGVPFSVDGHSGMVVYLSREKPSSNKTVSVLDHEHHDTYLHRAGTLLGHTVALTKAKKRLIETSIHVKHAVEHSWEDRHCDCGCLTAVTKKLMIVARKARGGGMAIPPPMTTQQALWTWLGTFLTLLVLSGINHALVTTTDHSLLIGPFGALMTLQYGLTAAPASQPRNAVLGQIVSGAIALVFTYLPIPQWLQQALGPAFSVTAMCRLGIPHPPAGAHAVLYAAGNDKWQLYGIVVMCTVVSCLMATVINNFSEKRQYPTYWGPLIDRLAQNIRKFMGWNGKMA